ncbi:MAG: site-specific integrase [Pseudomonadota bacterium]
MSLYKPAKSRFWHFDFQFQRRRHHGSTGCTSKRDAERVEAEARRRAAIGEEAKPTITMEKATGAWWEAKGQYLRSEATVIYQLDNLAKGLGRNVAISDIALADIDLYIARRRATVKNASVNRETALFRRVVNFCADRGFEVPAIKWAATKLSEDAPTTRILTREEETRLFEHLSDNLKPIVAFALLSGQRKTEIVTMRWSDVDLGAGRATVWAKGQKPHSFPLTPRMVALIANQPKVCAQVFTYIAERDSPPRADRPRRLKGHRYPFSRQGWDRKWRKALKDAGIEGYRFHDNRHTGLTRTGSIEVANKLAGHTDMRTTKRYFHVAEDEVRNAMAAGESRNSPEPPAAEGEKGRKAANDQ